MTLLPYIYTGFDILAEGAAYELTYKGVDVEIAKDDGEAAIGISIEVEDTEAKTLWRAKLTLGLDAAALCQTTDQLTPIVNTTISSVLMEELPFLRHENLTEIVAEVDDLLGAFLPR
ncbi:hypothetical protein [Mesorhizobium sp. M8A.F.Ca.ET.021.01.1.1]|uniref:hypothetical protein n=1 Tax=Mesorhizobium sp. M8A.F.Ca.ET.021.01.1.1 TaxID=2496757 RepID=UPI000FCAF65E|nr:hypothetical protein [Mesorhizobium sp. M8A.F.Ca.ET.021.01.1.1]RUW56721.1 hypothetical protein EOA36_02740 [Mesorhizobium sp. M8A.F.Ca.ET.021.01.1.1]